ncbi:NUDIX hydrolase [Cohnella terricola]|uniref:NUDIX domain-containing protein n=1 Tax=Cohnella terricola TaxID=1289167 RepID=A0A559JN68_9BACL|nr:NUDIX domain-containing protein [Cohnella terricola]TVY01322.1 NUDIX domain-containing protein [Cohnella terricola]
MAEMFDVYDETGNRIGIAERKEAHAKGLWHRTVHCWLVRRVELEDVSSSSVLFQKRSADKDTNPGLFDITAAGHLQAGESPQAVVRELEEELGVSVHFEQLSEIGVFRERLTGESGGISYIDAEFSHVFGLAVSMDPMEFRLQEEEVAGLYEANADELISLMEGRLERILARGAELRNGKLQASEIEIARSSFVARDYDYYVAVFKFLRDLT